MALVFLRNTIFTSRCHLRSNLEGLGCEAEPSLALSGDRDEALVPQSGLDASNIRHRHLIGTIGEGSEPRSPCSPGRIRSDDRFFQVRATHGSEEWPGPIRKYAAVGADQPISEIIVEGGDGDHRCVAE
jgi:hypothetical protein